MANGKITWEAPPFVAVELDGAHYLGLSSADFNPGTSHFSGDILCTIDPAAGTWVDLITKGAWPHASNHVYNLCVNTSTRKLYLNYNDGSATAIQAYSAANAVPALGTAFWAALRLNRTALTLEGLVNGVVVVTLDISSRSGSCDPGDPLWIGYDDAFKGAVSMVRFDKGRVLPDAWYLAEWDRLRYGLLPREGLDFLEVWNFNTSLVGEQGHTLGWNGGGEASYTLGYPSGTISYALAQNYNDGHREPFLDGPDPCRTLDGSSCSYDPGWRKRRLEWQFRYVNRGQVTAIMAAALARTPVTFYPDADLPPLFTGLFVKEPEFQEEMHNLWRGDIEAEGE